MYRYNFCHHDVEPAVSKPVFYTANPGEEMPEKIVTISHKYHSLSYKRKKRLLEMMAKWVQKELEKLELLEAKS